MAWSEAQLFQLLRGRYPAESYALFSQVRNSIGFVRHARYADALALGLWQSRGLLLYGFEIKSTRSDWLRELKDPEKQELGVLQYCDHWYLVTDEKVVHLAQQLQEINKTQDGDT